MAKTRRVYTQIDRARVYAELTANEGNVKRTARNTGVPISTVRFWRDEWRLGGVPATVQEALPAVAGDFIEDATRVRDKIIVELERAVDRGEIKPQQLITGLGVLTDKIRAYQGLEHHSRVDVVHEFPDIDQVRQDFAVVFRELVAAGNKRQEIIDAEWEPADEALPSAEEVAT